MRKALRIFAVLFCVSALYAAGDVVRAVHGTITRFDYAAKTVTLKAMDGSEQTLDWSLTEKLQGSIRFSARFSPLRKQ